ncbi:MAG: NADPH-dependent glutamate synthase [Bradymonadales bacterium]|nr:NADPH-dependent glutamate synthase [Bradymonadales bacterium]
MSDKPVLTVKDRLKIPVQPMPEQPPQERIHNVREVPLGYTPEQAMREADRCIRCKKPTCIDGCPVNIDIPGFISLISEGKFLEAAALIKKRNLLPAVCGRVCPQEEQCQLHCMVAKSLKDPSKAVQIGKLERFVADYERAQGELPVPELPPKTGKKVAVVGSGPAGLTVAGDLILLGHDVTIFEALHKPGGVLIYGIPEFRLPKAIVQQEVQYLQKLGVEVKYNYIIGKIRSVEELLDQYDAVFIGTGAGLPNFLGIPGENLLGVFSANEFLTRANLMKAYDFPHSDTPIYRPKNLAVVGGGNVAMDSARTGLRLGAESVTIVYRRTEKEMPARIEEVHHAKEEGVKFDLLRNPVRIVGDEKGWVKGMEVIKMELGEPDASGRRRPVPVPGSEYFTEFDAVVVAIGNSPNPLIPRETPDLRTQRWGGVIVDEQTMRTSKKGVFAGGDIVLGAATVILAMGHGRQAARSIQEYLTTGVWDQAPQAGTQ